MWSFCHFLPLMIGDLIPDNNKHWTLLCLLVEIMDEVLKIEFDETTLNRLQNTIEKHHSLYVQLFGNTLKPKHHFLTHYPSIIRQVGPLKHLWCFKFESKHRELKLYTNSITSRKNTPLSIGTKCMLKFSNRLLLEKGLQNIYNLGDIKQCKLVNKWYYNQILHISNENYYEKLNNFTDKVTVKETMYKVGYFLLSKKMILYEIKDILVLSDIEIEFICLKHKTSPYLQHYQSFSVLEEENIYLLKPTEFFKSPLHLSYSPNGKKYIRPKYY